MLSAHINPKTLKEQSVTEHLYNVSKLSGQYGAKISLAATGELIGILHDMGKGTSVFDKYIHYSAANPNDKSLRGSVNHSTAGAKLIYDSFHVTDNPYQKITAQITSLAICSHHGSLIDCLDLSGFEIFTDKMTTEKETYYDEALKNFVIEIPLVKIKDLFEKAIEEVKALLFKVNQIDDSQKYGQFAAGMLAKYLFSCLIDADRYDTYTFMEGREAKQNIDRRALWTELADLLEAKLKNYPKQNKIDVLRDKISISCRNFGQNNPGIYQLCVPTGGGKTLSSLRYALEHAKKFNKDRIFYIIPFTTIIDQNAKEIRDILGHEEMILEHHSNLVRDNEQEDYKLLTERWDSPIILTTMVQFLDTLFSGGTQNVRRMHNLANSVIIFDEIQAIPIKCINMFNSAINFLSYLCNATIILCTATQPLLSKTEMPIKLSEKANILPDIHTQYQLFKRVNLIDRRLVGGYSPAAMREFVLSAINQVKSVLVITNTKNSAKEVFNELELIKSDLPESKQYLIYHLSTGMCPSHRLKILQEIRENLGHHRLICISTQLIEAGVNISFECVVRSLAGLDSIAQAVGRCNRHGEKACSDAYIVNLEREDVSKLVDIKAGQESSKRILDEFKKDPSVFDNDLLSPKAMDRYYKYYFYERRNQMNYTLSKPDNDKSMYDLLSGNSAADNAFRGRNGHRSKLLLKQSFKTAGNNFHVIDQNTTSVIVPYEEGKTLISLINGECSLSDLKGNIKRAQHYSVNLFETDLRKIQAMGGLTALKGGALLALKDGFYREDIGVTLEGAPMEFCFC